MTIEKSLHRILFLYQEEGWETATRTGLQTYQSLDHLQSLSSSPYSSTN